MIQLNAKTVGYIMPENKKNRTESLSIVEQKYLVI